MPATIADDMIMISSSLSSKARTFYVPLQSLRRPNARDPGQISGTGSTSERIDAGMH